ncbi:MAG: glutamine synthetase III [Planctomycetota bacterium]|jgi:glutamine synthetase|nr:glutamine synthetase III [Planctomycetota bacterium]
MIALIVAEFEGAECRSYIFMSRTFLEKDMTTTRDWAAENAAVTFATDVFNCSAMRKYLSPRVFSSFTEAIRKGEPLDQSLADEIADGMKTWAMEKGATHFTHWFQPLTGSTAEKHDSFFAPDQQGGVIAQFTGKELIQGEPDASSFPSGGLRATFEARGYTAWDPTSDAFVVNANTDRAVLCIPCVFCGYHGEALDEKTPLLRSQAALANQLMRVARLFEIDGDRRPFATVGSEQEYFLIDLGFLEERPDLVMCGRTLFGRRPARHQQLEDHYFGRIKPRILSFMSAADRKLWRLGVPVKTRHNEVSPAQFELAPVFEEQNLAVDHNLLIMHTLQDTAQEHHFACLLHEKPFAGVNGSGKHNNWSLCGPDGKNWFSPGKTPHDNAKFLFMLVAVIKAIDTHAPLIRSSVATAGNDHRLGANEAPPAIMSVYLGEMLENILEKIHVGGSLRVGKGDAIIEIGVTSLPRIPKDVSDRNRTSPFAFTGNKFEFRSVGSSQSCALPNTVLNICMADAISKMCDALESKLPKPMPAKDASGHTREFHAALAAVLQKEISAHKRVIFGGDGYSREWEEEAERRGLPNIRTTPEALRVMIEPESIALYERFNVLSERETRSRYEVYRHAWDQTVAMEGRCALNLARTYVLPAALEWEDVLVKSVESVKSLGRDAALRLESFNKTAGLVDALHQALDELEKILDGDDATAVPAPLSRLRAVVDELEGLAADAIWPFPNYGEMFFNVARPRRMN